jgi:glycosyltransferase involved in cell wall biosynthesis
VRILAIATVPFFRPRGTPLSIYFRLQATRVLGHTVDLVTYPIGDPIEIAGVRILRTPCLPGVSRVGIGPSVRKIFLDALVYRECRRRLRETPYDLIHSHEEAAFFSRRLSREFSVPHLYDMHSLLSEQLRHYAFFGAAPFRALFAHLERKTVREAAVVVVISPALAEIVHAIDPSKRGRTVVIENMVDATDLPGAPPRAGSRGARDRLGLPANRVLALYAGSLEPYQGLDLLVRSVAPVVSAYPEITFVIVGGEPSQVERLRRMASREGILDHCVFTGSRPIGDVPDYIDAADILLSPRANGSNAPSKIYAYLKSGKPIVATDLPAHNQVLTRDISVLTAKDPASFSDGIVRLARDASLRREMGTRALAFASKRYSFEAFVERTRQALEAARS